MTEQQIISYLFTSYPKLHKLVVEGNIFISVDPKMMMPFATLMTNRAYDKFSNLDEPDRYRFNLGVTKSDFATLFNQSQMNWDYTQIDKIMPHPEYASQYFICVVNPSDETFEKLKPMIAEAYQIAIKRYGPKE